MEQHAHLSALLETYSTRIGIHLKPEQLKQFMVYLEELQTWNRSINLTSINSGEEIIIKHFVDSVACLTIEQIQQGAHLLDVGTGAGFPGIPLKLVRQDLNVTLIEPVQNKVSFLYFIVGLLRLEQVKIFYGTLEQFMARDHVDHQFDYVTTRALKYNVLLQNGPRLLADHGRAILYLSHPMHRSELSHHWSVVTEQRFDLPMNFGQRSITVLSISGKESVTVPRGTVN
ncbi:MAG TPA: 16S rRNA (guanine(527)-N(7))-methyltransferase RsmG [Nitrospira sp.]|nr:16S rRNA (guanine(527)-N(7))-methyltransferase RsmG [Nitrospira sp.]